MAARKTASKGSKPDKLIRDAVIIELHREVNDPEDAARKVRRLQILARSIVTSAIAGDSTVIKEVFDRVDGKQQSINPLLQGFPASEDGSQVSSIEVHFVKPDPKLIEHEPMNGKANGHGKG